MSNSAETPSSESNPNNTQADWQAPNVLWTFTVLGLVVAALARFAASDAEALTQLWAIVIGAIVSIGAVGLVVLIIGLPGLIRLSLIRRTDTGSRAFNATVRMRVSASGGHLHAPDLMARQSGASCTVVLSERNVEFWRGVRKPTIAVSIAYTEIESVTASRVQLSASRFWGAVIAMNTNGAPDSLSVVPSGFMLLPFSKRRVRLLVKEMDGLIKAAG